MKAISMILGLVGLGGVGYVLLRPSAALAKNSQVSYRDSTGSVHTISTVPQVQAIMLQAAQTNNPITMREVAGKLIDQGYKVEGSAMLQAIDAMAALKIPGNQAMGAAND